MPSTKESSSSCVRRWIIGGFHGLRSLETVTFSIFPTWISAGQATTKLTHAVSLPSDKATTNGFVIVREAEEVANA